MVVMEKLSDEQIRLVNDIWDYLERLKNCHIGEDRLFLLKDLIFRDGEIADEATLRNIRLKLKEKWDKTPPKPTIEGGEGQYDNAN